MYISTYHLLKIPVSINKDEKPPRLLDCSSDVEVDGLWGGEFSWVCEVDLMGSEGCGEQEALGSMSGISKT